jgi:protein TonB
VDDYKSTDMPTEDDLFKNMIGAENIVGKGDVNIIQPPAGMKESKGSIAMPAAVAKAEDVPVSFAEVMPEYPGGIDALRRYILKNLIQPDDLQEGDKIVVMASFIVDKTGRIESVKIIGSGRSDLDKEVLKVIKKMPLWKPGMQNGKPVSVYFKLPVTFLSVE